MTFFFVIAFALLIIATSIKWVSLIANEASTKELPRAKVHRGS